MNYSLESVRDCNFWQALEEAGNRISSLALQRLLDQSNIEEEAVPLDVFLYDENYLKLPHLSEVQHNMISAMTDISKEAKYTEGVICWGKSGGKDFVSGICIARIMYQLLCMKSPQEEYKMSEDSFIDAINIAVNASQASDVFFQPFRNMINRAPIFRKL